MKPEDIILQKIEDFQPTDILIINIPLDAPEEELELLGKHLGERGVNFLVMPDGYTFTVWRGNRGMSDMKFVEESK